MDLATIIFGVTTIISIASIVAAVTETPKDNELLKKFYSVIELLALNIGKAAVQKAAPPKKRGRPKKVVEPTQQPEEVKEI